MLPKEKHSPLMSGDAEVEMLQSKRASEDILISNG